MSTVVSAAGVGGGGTADGSDCSPAMILVKKGPRDLNARGAARQECCGPNPYLTRLPLGRCTLITRNIDFTGIAGVKKLCNAMLGSRSAVWFSFL